MPLVFKTSSIKLAFEWRFFPEQLFSDLRRQKQKSLFAELTSFTKFVFSEVPSFYFGSKPPVVGKTVCKALVKISML